MSASEQLMGIVVPQYTIQGNQEPMQQGLNTGMASPFITTPAISIRSRLLTKQDELTRKLAEVTEALDALNNHPEALNVLELLAKTHCY